MRRIVFTVALCALIGFTNIANGAAKRAAANSTAASTRPEPQPRYAPLTLELVTATKRTVIADDRFTEFLAASTKKGYRTIQSFTVARRDLPSGAGRIVARVSFTMPSTVDEFPLYPECVAPRRGGLIGGIAWVVSDDGLRIDQASPVWGSTSCFGPV
jgi:hypothetical protein